MAQAAIAEKIRPVPKLNPRFAKRGPRKKAKPTNDFSFVPTIYTDFLKAIVNVGYIAVAVAMGILNAISVGFEKGLEQTLNIYRDHLKEKPGGKYHESRNIVK